MTDHSKVDGVGSGVPYVVTSVNDRTPESLDDFVSQAVVAMVVEHDQQVVQVRGAAWQDGESVVIYEKDHDGTGKDVRTWQIGITDGRFEAVERSRH